MALQNIGFCYIPAEPYNIGGTPGFLASSFTLDAADEKAAIVIQATETGTLSIIHFRTATVTTGATVDVRVETVDATTGLPTGTLWAANTNGSQVIGSGDDQTAFAVTLTSGASVTKGDLFAIVIVNPAGAPGNMQITGTDASVRPGVNFPYSLLYTTSYAKSTVNLSIGFEYNDGSFAPSPYNHFYTTISSTSYNNTTNPNHRGLYFQLTVPCRVIGFYTPYDIDNVADILLVDDSWDGTDGDALALYSLDPDIRRLATAGSWVGLFDAPVTLAANTIYRLIMKPTSASNIVEYRAVVSDVDMWAQTSAPAAFQLTTANDPNDATDWTQTTTERPFIGLVIDQFDDGANVGGGSVYNLAMQ